MIQNEMFNYLYKMYSVICNFPFIIAKFYFFIINGKYNEAEFIAEYIINGLKIYVIFLSLYILPSLNYYTIKEEIFDNIDFFREEYENMFGYLPDYYIDECSDFIDEYKNDFLDEYEKNDILSFTDVIDFLFSYFFDDYSYDPSENKLFRLLNKNLDFLKLLFFPNHYDDGFGWADIPISERKFSILIDILYKEEIGNMSKVDMIFSFICKDNNIDLFTHLPIKYSKEDLIEVYNIKESNKRIFNYLNKYNKSIDNILENNIDMITSQYMVKMFYIYKNII